MNCPNCGAELSYKQPEGIRPYWLCEDCDEHFYEEDLEDIDDLNADREYSKSKEGR